MRRKAKKTFLSMIIILVVIMVPYFIFKVNTTSYSPEDQVVFQLDDLILTIHYGRPYRQNRKIFGGWVPYGEIWRTGANEATVFSSNKDILIDGSLLPAGDYTLWTIPKEESWVVIFNSGLYPWGITADGVPSREADLDVLTVEVPSFTKEELIEQFTIELNSSFDLILMKLAWEHTEIAVPIKPIDTVPGNSF